MKIRRKIKNNNQKPKISANQSVVYPDEAHEEEPDSALSEENGQKAVAEAETIVKWNALLIRERDIVRVHIPVPIGDWYEWKGRPISIIQGNGDGLFPWRPKQYNICGGVVEKLDIRTPIDLYDILEWSSVVEPVYSQPGGLLEKLRVGLMFALVVVLFFFMYLIFSNLQGS